MLAPDAFTECVRDALNHLYDPAVLRDHPLADTFGTGGGRSPVHDLRATLIEAIDALKPGPDIPTHSRAWRIYQVLQLRYAQQMDQEQTADQLGVGARQLRRDQRAAVQALADRLYRETCEACEPEASTRRDAVHRRISEEVSWLGGAESSATCALREALDAAVGLLRPLAASCGVEIAPYRLGEISPVTFPLTALKQAIISAASYTIASVPGGRLAFVAREQGCQVTLTLQGHANGKLEEPDQRATDHLYAARTIVTLQEGELHQRTEGAVCSLDLTLPVAALVDVVLIDDNQDFADLAGRFTADSRFRLHPVSPGGDVMSPLLKLRPHLVVLDVMMPSMDGWEILARLRHHPETQTLPVIVCTVLPESDLARMLGASGYLTKPVSRHTFLEALDRVLCGQPSVSR